MNEAWRFTLVKAERGPAIRMHTGTPLATATGNERDETLATPLWFHVANGLNMVSRPWLKRALLGREVAVAFAVIVALYLVRFVRVQPLQIPAYLLIVAYDVVEVAVPILTPYYPVAFPVFLYLLAVGGGAAARWFRSDDDAEGTWRRSAGGVCLLVGSFSLAFGAYVGGPIVASMDNPTPLAITGATGIIMLVVGLLLLRRPTELRGATT